MSIIVTKKELIHPLLIAVTFESTYTESSRFP